jgi:ketosteroid isomerase-like protein
MAGHSSARQRATSEDIESVVRGYYAAVADLSSSESQLRSIVSPDLTVVEHPNAVTPQGATRDLESTVAGFLAGKTLLAEQAFDIHEVIVAGSRAAVRATWRGVVEIDAGPYRAGQELAAHVAAFVTIEDGLVVEHETFDCYRPIEPG